LTGTRPSCSFEGSRSTLTEGSFIFLGKVPYVAQRRKLQNSLSEDTDSVCGSRLRNARLHPSRVIPWRSGRMSTVYRAVTALILNVLSWMVYLLVVVALYFAGLRDLQMNWGATGEDIDRRMMGDEMLIEPELNATRAIEIESTPDRIWPWIAQMGYRRGGFYGFDNLDNGGFRSADSVLPEYQTLQAGDSIPGGEYKGQTFHILEVVEVDPGKEMLWVFSKGTPWAGATWSWGLYRIDDGRTRLVSRLRQKYSFESFQEVISWSLIDAIEILMMRTTLKGIKLRAERASQTVRSP